MKLIKKSALAGTIQITREDGLVVASFINDAVGSFAYGCFVAGLSRIDSSSVNAGTTLYDADTDEFIVGSVAELAG